MMHYPNTKDGRRFSFSLVTNLEPSASFFVSGEFNSLALANSIRCELNSLRIGPAK